MSDLEQPPGGTPPDTPAPPTPQPAPAQQPLETRGQRLRRRARRARLYAWSILLAIALIVIIALVVSNTRQVKVSWVFGDSRASLVWLVVVPAIVGWLGGLATAFVFRRRTRAPRP